MASTAGNSNVDQYGKYGKYGHWPNDKQSKTRMNIVWGEHQDLGHELLFRPTDDGSLKPRNTNALGTSPKCQNTHTQGVGAGQ